MQIVIIGQITYNEGLEGRVINCLKNLLLHWPAHKITLIALNQNGNWEYNGVRVLPLSNKEDIDKYAQVIGQASIGLAYLCDHDIAKKAMKLNPNCTWILDSFSEEYVDKAKLHCPLCFAYKFNRPQAEAFSSLKIKGIEDCRLCRKEMLAKGLKRGFITLNKDGVYFFDQTHDGIILSDTITRRTIKDAGDAFVAGILYGLTFTRNIDFLAKKGIELSAHHINQVLKKVFTFGSNFNDSNEQ